MERIENLGINTVNLEVDKAAELGLGRVELSVGKGQTYEEKINEFYKTLDTIKELSLLYSVHLPVYVPSWYTYHHFSAFFIDEDETKRELSFKLLEYNLDKLKDLSPEYFVLHFPGIAKKWADNNEFNKVLTKSLDRLDKIAMNYDIKLYLEYFGSNKNFYDYNEWINIIKSYNNLGILTDTGHLFFASITNNFDFYKAIEILAQSSDAFHLWTTKGNKTYCDSDYYKKYHHIGPNSNQNRKEGWAFDTERVVKLLITQNKPIIIEPSINYGGIDYLIKGIKSILKLF